MANNVHPNYSGGVGGGGEVTSYIWHSTFSALPDI